MLKVIKRKKTALHVEFDREKDGRWIAEILGLPGAMAYGATKQEATRKAYCIALRTLADTVERGRVPVVVSGLFATKTYL